MLEGLSSHWGNSGISSLWWTTSSALVLWCWHVEGQYEELLPGPVLWVRAPFPFDPLVLHPGEAVWTQLLSFVCIWVSFRKKQDHRERFYLDIWATLELWGAKKSYACPIVWAWALGTVQICGSLGRWTEDWRCKSMLDIIFPSRIDLKASRGPGEDEAEKFCI